MTRLQLRAYQTKAIDTAITSLQSNRGVFLVAPTGSGKTVMFSEIVRYAVERGHGVVILAHRKELLDQAANKLAMAGVDCGIIQAKRNTNPEARVQVCSIDTINRRELPFQPGLVIVDEAHLIASRRYKRFLENYPTAKRLLVSATPYRLDGKGFRDFADSLITAATVNELTGQGYLVPARYFTAPVPESVADVRVTCGDFQTDELEAVINTRVIRGGIVQSYQKHSPGRQTVVFGVSVKHSQELANTFIEEGIKAEHLDGNTPDTERASILKRFDAKKTQVICNVGVLCEGWDCPTTETVILARPTKSLSLYLQQVGRGLRPYPGKDHCLILDHGGCVDRFGPINEPRDWSLDGFAVAKQKAKKREQHSEKVCQNCFEFIPKLPGPCPVCNHNTSGLKVVEVESGLTEFVADDAHKMKRQYAGLIEETRRRINRKTGKPYHRDWAWFQLKDRYGYSQNELIQTLGWSRIPYSVRKGLAS